MHPALAPSAPDTAHLTWLPPLLHDIRGAAASISGLVSLLDARTEPQVLAALAARAEQLELTADALSVTHAGSPGYRSDPAGALRDIPARLKKFLARSQITLKFVGETPDVSVDARFLRVLLECLLVSVIDARSEPGPACVDIGIRQLGEGCRVTVHLLGQGWNRAIENLREVLASGRAAGSVEGLAMARCVSGLDASVRFDRRADGHDVHLDVPGPRGWRAPGCLR